MKKRWVQALQGNKETTALLAQQLNIDSSLAQILVQRGISSFEEARQYFRPDMLSDTWDRTDLTPETGLVPTFIDQPLKTVKLTPIRRSVFGLRRFMTAAAVLLVLTGIYFYRADIAKVFNPVAKAQLFSSAGERKQIRLADGTKVWLSRNSKLSYPDKFEGPDRQVSLEGEAFFEVTHACSI